MTEKNAQEYKYKYLQITIDEQFKKEVKKYAKDADCKTVSDFVRIALKEKIQRMKHPEKFLGNQKSNNIDPGLILQLTQNTQKLIKLQELNLEKTKLIEEMREDLNRIARFALKGLKEERERVWNLFQSHDSLSIKEIIEKTNYDEDIVFSIVSEFQKEKKIRMKNNGRFTKNA
ncbi:MAG: hypothetical protein ACOC1X_03965 [Promethearchaeota archaeon]